ncbi:glycoside hydrolase family 43 protein [Microbulbifer sp. CAU 1566]|uniref:glycoside hydrolase family 43 protein n=1 Tax=Microbulbifer sp. CAU 1566 TaxID=2933269 RepID=UPI0020045D30|nr:glycoside hydrolase family 43 protein [Microbulbifer sp. CAU 1566]MCK7596315.1 glycoside hydrolase family 43 protein [Microbulbifer sp. CAU 1566]
MNFPSLFPRVLACACLWLSASVAAAPPTQNDMSLHDMSLQGHIPSPLVARRADPWVIRRDGFYYFIATVPEYDRIELRRAETIAGLAEADAEVIWRKHAAGPMSAHIWAPELHYIDDAWIIYFAAGEAEDPWKIRMYALRNSAANPLLGDWQEMGQMATPVDSFSLDATSFTHRGKRYLVWAQYDVKDDLGSQLLMAEMVSATEIRPPAITLSTPTFDWETRGHKVNEGPAVLKKNGRVFISYSASATDANYAMGLLWADEGADLMNPRSWNKSPQPVFYTSAERKRFGPGHNSFTVAEDGVTDLVVYHARDYRNIQGNPLLDGNRATRVRVLHWDASGMPEFRQQAAD